MKTVKQLLEQYDTLVNKQTNENQKLVELVREGLLDEDKLPLIERALSLDSELLTIAEQNAANELLESLITFFILEKKEDTMDALVKKIKGSEDEGDTNYPTNKQAPALLMFQRKAVRVFPDNMRVVVYYSPVLDKYISIPFGGKSLNVTTNINEEIINEIGDTFKGRDRLARYADRGGAIGKGSRQTRDERQQTVDKSKSRGDQWSKERDSKEDEFVHKLHGPRAARANAEAREKAKKASDKRDSVSRITTAKGASKFKTGSGALRIAINHKMDNTPEAFGHTGRLAAGLGTAASGLIRRGIEKVRSLKEENIEEAKTSYKNIFKFATSRKKKTSGKSSLDSRFKVKKASAPKSTTTPVKATPAKKQSTPAPKKKEDVNKHISDYKETIKKFRRSTDTKVRLYNSEKGKHEDVGMKNLLRDRAKDLVHKIKSSGGKVPVVDRQDTQKRAEGRKPPPALAEAGPIIPLALAGARAAAPHVARGAGALLRGAKNLLKRKPKPGAKKLPLSKTRPMPKGRPGGKLAAAGAGAAAGSAASRGGGSNVTSDSERKSGTDRRSHDLAANRNSQGTKIRSPGEPISRSDAERVKRTGTSSIGTNSVNESHLKTIRAFVKEGSDKLDLSYGDHAISINNRLGKKLLSVYESLNADNKLKVETMLNESADSARKVINFVVRN